MRRLVDHWWLVGTALVVAVIILAGVLYAGESDRHQQQQRATQHQAVTVLSESVDDVLAREVALARVVGTLGGPVGARWPVLSDIVVSQPLANSTGFIQPVSEQGRAAFERRTGLRLVESQSRACCVSPAGGRCIWCSPPTDRWGPGRRRSVSTWQPIRCAAACCWKRRGRGFSSPLRQSSSSDARIQRVAWRCLPRSGINAALERLG